MRSVWAVGRVNPLYKEQRRGPEEGWRWRRPWAGWKLQGLFAGVPVPRQNVEWAPCDALLGQIMCLWGPKDPEVASVRGA